MCIPMLVWTLHSTITPSTPPPLPSPPLPLPSHLHPRTTCGYTVNRRETCGEQRWTLRRTRDKWRGASRSTNKVRSW